MKKNKTLMIVLGVFALVIVTTGASFAFFQYQRTGNTKVNVTSGDIQFSYMEDNQNAKLVNAFPVADSVGAVDITGEYEFTVSMTSSSSTTVTKYNVILLDNNNGESNYFTNDQIKFALVKNNVYVAGTSSEHGLKLSEVSGFTSTLTTGEGTVLSDQEITSGTTDTYKLRIWISDDVSYNNDITTGVETGKYNGYTYSLKVKVATAEIGLYQDNSGAAIPELSDNLIPVTLKDDGTVIKANPKEKWYDYNNKEWANAIVLMDKSVKYEDGATIPESNIESYFVWIPKYSYKLFNLGNYSSLTSVTNAEQTIDVKFDLTNTSDSNSGECTTPMTSGSTGSCQVGDYMTHPAFISMDTNGLWVGKFETGYEGATSKNTAQVNGSDSSKIIIKPNTYSWRSIQVANSFTASYNYLRNADSHMMKNTEWGAVSYLQHSKYGSQISVRINNNNSYITGYAAVEEPTIGYTGVHCTETVTENCNVYGTSSNITQPYNTSAGYLASTTGNITGIYDMSGGAYEFVMGVLADTDGNPVSGRSKTYNAGFKGNYSCPTCDSNIETENILGVDFPLAKYYDVYKYGNNNQTFNSRILGDATGEMGPFANAKYGTLTRIISSWYEDNSHFPTLSIPWFYRGGSWGWASSAGIFNFFSYYGSANADISFRVVLAP